MRRACAGGVGVLAGSLSNEVVGHVFDCGEIGGRVIGSEAALVVAEDHIHDPMQAILDRPMSAHDRSQEVGQQDQRGDVEPRLLLDLVAVPPTRSEDVAGILKYSGPPKTLEEMDAAITAEVKRRHARGRY